MLIFHLAVIYLLELSVYAGGTVWAHGAGVALPWIATGLLLAPLLLRALIVGFMFALAWRHRSPRPASLTATGGGYLRLFLREYCVLVVLYTGFMLFEPLLRRRLSDRAEPGGPIPVLFVHGFFCNSGYWWSLLRYLRARGHANLFTLNLMPVHGTIDDFAAQLETRVEEILAATAQDRVVLVGHSMGGLVSRAYYRRHGGVGHVARIISLGSPHHGTYHAHLSRALGALDMRVGSQWLVDLEKLETEADGSQTVPITSIYTIHDNIVSPRNSGELLHARNIALAGMGHLSLAWDRTVQELVAHELAPDSGDEPDHLQKVAVDPRSRPFNAPSRESIPS